VIITSFAKLLLNKKPSTLELYV